MGKYKYSGDIQELFNTFRMVFDVSNINYLNIDDDNFDVNGWIYSLRDKNTNPYINISDGFFENGYIFQIKKECEESLDISISISYILQEFVTIEILEKIVNNLDLDINWELDTNPQFQIVEREIKLRSIKLL